MDASTREELLWQASHGGRNQRALAREQLLPAGVSASVSGTVHFASPFNRFESDVVAYIVGQWAWGLLSAPEVQKLAATSVEDQKRLLNRIPADRSFVSESLVALAGIGCGGRYRGNAHRDLCVMIGELSVPKPLRALVFPKRF